MRKPKCMISFAILFLIILFCLLHSDVSLSNQGILDPWLSSEMKRMDEVKAAGKVHTLIQFNLHRLYRDSKSINSLNQQSVQDYRTLIQYAKS